MKHLLLSASLLLFAGNMNAQLYVSPNAIAGTDSYIYANDVVLYVENDINLQLNNINPETQASIYLRGDAQLIQGDKPLGSTNSGTGSISILQRGWANAFDYNYWASPVGVPEGAAGNRNFGITRFFDVQGNGTHPTHSMPQQTITTLNGQTGPLRISSRWIYTLRNSNEYAQWAYIANSSNLVAGEGFTMKGTGLPAQVGNAHAQLYDFRGRPNDGDISITVAHNGTDGLSRLVGNPYPSTLDMEAFINDPTNINAIEGYVLFWDQNREVNSHYIAAYQGGYGVWQPGGGDPVPAEYGGGTTGMYARAPILTYDGSGTQTGDTNTFGEIYTGRFSPPGQGFIVIGSENTTGNLVINNSMRKYVPYGELYNNEFKHLVDEPSFLDSDVDVTSVSKSTEYLLPTLRFHTEVNGLYYRDMVLMFSPESTNGKDRGWDSKHPSLIDNGDVYWKLEGETNPYVIQTRPFDRHSKVPIGFRVKNGPNSFKVNLVEMKGFDNFNNFRLFLYDELNNSYQQLNLGGQALVNHSGSAGNIDNRYYLVFKRGHGNSGQNGNGNGNNKSLAGIDFFQNNPQSKLQISNPDLLNIKNASVYDMRGRLVINESNLGTVSHYSFSTQGLSSGIYLVKLSTAENGIIDYKITVHNR